MGFTWIEFKSRQERERDAQDYLLRIFPGGKEQKKMVEKELTRRLPGADVKGLMLYYVLIRDAMTRRDSVSFDMAASTAMKTQRRVKVTPKIIAVIKEVMAENS